MSNSVDNNVKAFFQGTAIFTVASVLTKVAQILLLPLISDHLSPEQLGIADMIQMLYSFLYPVLVMGFDAAFGAFYFEQSGKEYQRRVFNTIFFHLVCMSGIAAVGMLFACLCGGHSRQSTNTYGLPLDCSVFAISTHGKAHEGVFGCYIGWKFYPADG